MSSTIIPDDQINNKFVFDLVCRYLRDEWSSKSTVDDIEIVKYRKDEWVDRYYLIKNRSPKVSEKYSVIVLKLNGGNRIPIFDFAEKNLIPNEIESSIIQYELSCRQNVGFPVIFGIFPGGLIQEFVSGHTLTFQESLLPVRRQHLMNLFAKFHYLEFPIRRNMLEHQFRYLTEDYLRQISDLNTEVDIKDVLDVDWKSEIKWYLEKLESTNARFVSTFWAPDHSSFVVRDKQEPEVEDGYQLFYQRLGITNFGPRGSDIGGHLVARFFEKSIEDPKIPRPEERREYCTEYLDEWRRLRPDIYDPEIDNVDHLMAEVDVGVFGHMLSHMGIMVADIPYFAKMADESPLKFTLSNLVKAKKLYFDLKKMIFGPNIC